MHHVVNDWMLKSSTTKSGYTEWQALTRHNVKPSPASKRIYPAFVDPELSRTSHGYVPFAVDTEGKAEVATRETSESCQAP